MPEWQVRSARKRCDPFHGLSITSHMITSPQTGKRVGEGSVVCRGAVCTRSPDCAIADDVRTGAGCSSFAQDCILFRRHHRPAA